MKNIFVAIVEKASRVDRFEMAVRPQLAFSIFDCDGFDPVNGILQHESIAQRHHYFMRQHRIGWRGTNVEKKRTVGVQYTPNLFRPFSTPIQVRSSVLPVRILFVANSEIVRRRRYHKIDTFFRQPRHSLNAILPPKIKLCHTIVNHRVVAQLVQPGIRARAFCLWGAQAASLSFSAACRKDLQRFDKKRSSPPEIARRQAAHEHRLSACVPQTSRHSHVAAYSFIFRAWPTSLRN